MAHQQLFKEFIVLFKNWHVDATKSGRCFGEYLRKQFNQDFKQGELSIVDNAKWSKILEDLTPIVNNIYFSKYKRHRAIGSLGLGKEQCKMVVSNKSFEIFSGKKN